MRKYKTEMHCHSSEVSGCSSVDVKGVVEKYIKHGYSTVVLTNHFWSCDDLEKYKAKVERLFEVCDEARRIAGDRLNIIDGVEVALDDDNDYLLYGVTKEFLLSLPHISDLEAHELRAKASDAGMILIHAHPLRYNQRHLHPSAIDGYEIFNGHPEQESNNDAAELMFGRMKGKIFTSGTDHHDPHHVPNSGIVTEKPIKTKEDLLATLRSGDYSIIKNGEVFDL